MDHVIGVTLVLWVDSYERAIAFYDKQTQLFSLIANINLGNDTKNVVLAYRNPKAPFRLNIFLATNSITSALVGRQGGDHALFVLPVEDCMGEYERLTKAGVEFTGEPVSLPYGCQATMSDPFGNRICLSERY